MQAALIVLDGWGLSGGDGRDAIRAARTPNVDRLRETCAYGTLEVSGRRVGLPEGQMGNSEVGHLNIGAGRVVVQELARIDDAIRDGTFRTNEVFQSVFSHAEDSGGRVHFMGLVSDGGVHSSQAHLHALIEMATDRGVPAVTHAFTDGRDTAPKAGADFLRALQSVIDEHDTGHVATVSGRYYAMDRDQNWERTRRAYDAIVNRNATHIAASAVEAVERAYERAETDEFVEPTVIEGEPAVGGGPAIESGPALAEGDAVVFFNFRADRARQLVRMLADLRPEWPFETTPPDHRLVTMTQYDETFDLPVAFPPSRPTDTLGEVLAAHGLTQLRIAETEKYAHVTYFLNGGREVAFETAPPDHRLVTMTQYDETFDLPVAFPPSRLTDTLGEVIAAHGLTQLRIAETEKYAHVTYFLNGGREVAFEGERREIVPSPDVPTYDLKPAMSAAGVTDAAIEIIESDDPDVLVLNYANPDMVGHTGDFEAAVAAVEAVDEQVGRLVPAIHRAGGHVLVTADHGNADDMGTEEEPHTAHTYNAVPFVYCSPAGDDGGYVVRAGGTLADVAPTILGLIGVEQPAAMTGESLLAVR